MKRLLPPSALSATLLAGALLAASAGGAVAGALITSAQIKDGTITSVDIKNKTIRSSDISAATVASLAGASSPISGYELVQEESSVVAAGALGTVSASCPAGKKALGAGAFWFNTFSALQVFPVDAGASKTTWLAGGNNTSGSPDQITLSLVCADAS